MQAPVQFQTQVLVHYTTSEAVYNKFDADDFPFYGKRLTIVKEYYEKYHKKQEYLFFIIAYTDFSSSDVNYRVGKVFLDGNNNLKYNKIEDRMKEEILKELGLENNSTYQKDVFYREHTLTDKNEFYCINIQNSSHKIKLKYYTWEEILSHKPTLFKKIIGILFEQNNVLNLASMYNPDPRYTTEILERKYQSALDGIGFIVDGGIKTDSTTLHGDIGEFLAHHLVQEFLDS